MRKRIGVLLMLGRVHPQLRQLHHIRKKVLSDILSSFRIWLSYIRNAFRICYDYLPNLLEVQLQLTSPVHGIYKILYTSTFYELKWGVLDPYHISSESTDLCLKLAFSNNQISQNLNFLPIFFPFRQIKKINK